VSTDASADDQVGGSKLRLVKFGFTGRQWLIIGLLWLGILFMSWTWGALEPAPPEGEWPSYFPWDPQTQALVFPDTGDHAKQMMVLKGWLDARMPFVPLLAIPYIAAMLIWPIVIPFLGVLVGSYRRYLTLAFALITSMAILDLGMWMYHTKVIRDVDPEGLLGGSLVKVIYEADPMGMGGWPSGHVTWSMVCILALWRMRKAIPKTAWTLIVVLLLVFPATVMLRQHYLIDVYTGILLGFASYWACMFVIERPKLVPRGEETYPRRKPSVRS